MITDFELGWLVAFLEGEGSFLMNRNCPMISLQQNDRDIMAKYVSILEKVTGSTFNPGFLCNSDRPATYQLAVYGDNAIAVMKLVMRHMGERRRQKIRQILEKRNESKAA